MMVDLIGDTNWLLDHNQVATDPARGHAGPALGLIER